MGRSSISTTLSFDGIEIQIDNIENATINQSENKITIGYTRNNFEYRLSNNLDDDELVFENKNIPLGKLLFKRTHYRWEEFMQIIEKFDNFTNVCGEKKCLNCSSSEGEYIMFCFKKKPLYFCELCYATLGNSELTESFSKFIGETRCLECAKKISPDTNNLSPTSWERKYCTYQCYKKHALE